MGNFAVNWEDAVIKEDATIAAAVEVLEKCGLRILLMVQNETFLGTITDGDIRRGLLRGLSLDSHVRLVLNTNPVNGLQSWDEITLQQAMTSSLVQQIPIIDASMRLTGLYIWGPNLRSGARQNQVIIMAGGKGTRLYPKTEDCPKPLLSVGGKPILEHIIVRARKEGFINFVIAIHHLGHKIEKYFGDGSSLGVKIDYLREEEPLGTAGALSLLNPRPEIPILVTNGDVLTDIRYGELLDFHVEQNAIGTMAVRSHQIQNPYGVVETNGIEIVGYKEKPSYSSYINAGVYVLNPTLVNRVTPSKPTQMPELFEILQSQNERIVAYLVHEQWHDVGSFETLAEAQRNENQ